MDFSSFFLAVKQETEQTLILIQREITPLKVTQGIRRHCAMNSPRITIRGDNNILRAHMKTLYKYYSEKLDVIEHLINPSIKLAATSSLNDPFENKLSYELAKNITMSMNLGDKENNYQITEKFKEMYTNVTSNFGVVSLTETHENILMWAHYANSHKGVCIGYKEDLFKDLDSKEGAEDFWRGIYAPKMVSYASQRFNPEQFSKDITRNEIILRAMLKKSNHWKYEKELRCIVPFALADKFTISNESGNLQKIIKSKLNNRTIKKIGSKNEYIYTQENSLDSIWFLMCSLAKHEGVTMLKNIDINSIESIFLGSQFNDENANKIANLVKSDPSRYGHISVYKYHIHGNEFRLYTEGLVNPKILTDINDVFLNTQLDGFKYQKITVKNET